jgi:hypothetical protein
LISGAKEIASIDLVGFRPKSGGYTRSGALNGTFSSVRLIWLLLLIPYVALLWVPFYNHKTPELFGFPFFYWYQLAFVPLTSLLIYIVYRLARNDR